MANFRPILPKPIGFIEDNDETKLLFYDTVSLMRTALLNETEATDPDNIKLSKKALAKVKHSIMNDLKKEENIKARNIIQFFLT